jgi:hypothetical protein
MPASADFFVATNGNDAWSGTIPEPAGEGNDGPFRTLERARDEIRNRRDAGFYRDRPVRVVVRGGTYALSRSFALEAWDSGSENNPVTYQACPGETVRLMGGQLVPPDAFRPVTDTNVLGRLDPSAQTHVRAADLRGLGITDLGRLPPKFEGAPAVPELFFNDQRLMLARWPNEGWAHIAAIVETGSDYQGTNVGVFEYSGDRPARWKAETGVWLHGYWAFDWNDEVLQVRAIDPATRRITLAAHAVYSVKQGNPAPRRFYAFNLLEELDRPGEYFIDRNAGLLYLWPPSDPAQARIALSTLHAPVVSITGATGLVWRGFIIEASLGSGFEVHGGCGVRLQACEVRNTREFEIRIEGGVGHRVEACDLHDTGTGGILLSGGDRRTLTPAGHEAVNNHIWNFAVHKRTYSNALQLQGVGQRASHNLIHDAPHQAVSLEGNDHLFEYNLVRNVCLASDDCGALYKGRNPSCRGNMIRFNIWRDIGSPLGHGQAAIYFDDGDGGDTVFGNLFIRCGHPGLGSFGAVFSHGGHDNLADNNVFVDCGRALGSAPWPDDRWQKALRENRGEGWNWPDKLLREVDITKPPYTERYPELAGFLDPASDRPRVNRARRNMFVRCAEASGGNWQLLPGDNWAADQDPGFVNPGQEDYRLRSDSAVWARLPGFEPIPIETIGLVTNALRPRLPESGRP